jgi:phage terminase large subunit GpA-like protein
MLAVTEPGVQTITAMVSTQLMKTALLENILGFHAHLDPCPMLLVQPKEDAAEQFSKERITPMVRATPALRNLIGGSKTRSSKETLLYKSFPGGFLALVGAGSPDNLARRPVRIVMYDEVDKYPALKEGDAFTIGDERLGTFNSKALSVRVCSPTIDSESRIEASYNTGDHRRASCACPHCGHRQFLDFWKHVEWEHEPEHQPRTARVHCEKCGVIWSEGDRLKSVAGATATIRWHQTRPFHCCGARHVPLDAYDAAWRGPAAEPVGEVWDWWSAARYAVYRAKCPTCGTWKVDNDHASFQASKLFSPWRRDQPSMMATKWLAAQGDEEKKQAWWNTQLGLPYRRNAGKDLRLEALLARCEHWAAETPDGVAVLTAGIDTQEDRFEVEVVGWGRNEESWSIDFEVIDGDPADPSTRKRLDDYLKRTWRRADGRPFEIMAACIDSGGSRTEHVYQFAKERLGRRIWAIKGESARGGQRSPVWPSKRPSSRNKKAFRPIILGVNAAKDAIRANLYVEKPGPRYMHYPHLRDVGYFAQLTAERLTVKSVSGQRFSVWELPPGKANEALDCRVYAYGALAGLVHQGLKLNRRAEEVGAAITPFIRLAVEPAPPEPAQPTPEPTPAAPTRPMVQIEKKRPGRRLA